MDLKSGYPYWLIKNGLTDTYPGLRQNHKCEVLIIGGGISGALSAYHLCNAGFDVTIVDRRHFGIGSTCASTALIQYETDDEFTTLVNKYGEEKATSIHQLTLKAVNDLGTLIKKNKIDCEYKQRSSLYFASRIKDKKRLIADFEARTKAGFSLELWDQKMIESKFPFTASAAIWSRNGAELDALKLTNSLLKIISNKGASLFNRTNIVKIIKTKNKFVVTTDSGKIIKAKHVVVASGYESEQFLSKKYSTLHSTYALISEPVAPSHLWYQSCLIWETARPYSYLRTTSDNRIIIGGKDEPFYNPLKRDAMMKKKNKDLIHTYSKMFPDTKIISDFSWTGTFAETKDSLPYIDKRYGINYILGFGGNGITFSQMAGALLPDLIKGRTNPDLKLFSFQR